MCCVSSSKQAISLAFGTSFRKEIKEGGGFGDIVCPCKTTLRVCSKSGRGEWSAGASRRVFHREEGLCEKEDGGIGGGCAKSTERIKPAKEIMRAHATQQLQHCRIYICGVPGV